MSTAEPCRKYKGLFYTTYASLAGSKPATAHRRCHVTTQPASGRLLSYGDEGLIGRCHGSKLQEWTQKEGPAVRPGGSPKIQPCCRRSTGSIKAWSDLPMRWSSR